MRRSRRLSTYNIISSGHSKGICAEVRNKFHEFDTGRKGGLYEIEVMHLLDFMFPSDPHLSLKYKKEFNSGWTQDIVVYTIPPSIFLLLTHFLLVGYRRILLHV